MSRQVATQSAQMFAELNHALAGVAAKVGGRVVDVAGAFAATETHERAEPRAGRAPWTRTSQSPWTQIVDSRYDAYQVAHSRPLSVPPEMMRFMVYDQDLADRIRELVAGEDGLVQQKMFGGLAFLINGNMAVAASSHGGLLVRVDPADADVWVDGERVTPMVMRGREMRGWLRVVSGLEGQRLDQWVSRGVAYARSLPPKST